MNIQYQKLVADFGEDKARTMFDKICEIGGFGEGYRYYGHAGGLDISGLDAGKQKKIEGILSPSKSDESKTSQKPEKAT